MQSAHTVGKFISANCFKKLDVSSVDCFVIVLMMFITCMQDGGSSLVHALSTCG
jgi:hypothetical protein